MFASFVIGLVLVQMAGCSSGTTRPKAAVSGDTVHFTLSVTPKSPVTGPLTLTDPLDPALQLTSVRVGTSDVNPCGATPVVLGPFTVEAVAAGGFEQVHGAFDVDALVKGRLQQAGPNPGACGQVNDLIEPDAGHQFVEAGAVSEVAANECERSGERLEIANVGQFDLRVVKVVQVVERPDRLAIPQQAFANMVADEPRAAGDQKVHGGIMGSNLQCSRSKVNP